MLEVDLPEPVRVDLHPEPLALEVLYEDADLIVVDKAAGMVVHPAPGHTRGTLVNALLHHCGDLAGIGGVLRPGIVHRLDQGTSGVMVAAKRDRAHQELAQQFFDHSIGRRYVCLVRGTPRVDDGTIDRPIGRHPRDRKRMSVSTRRGKAARTHFRVEERFPRTALAQLGIRLDTGRTHQIRVHLASIGLPVLADPIYGRSRRGASDFGLTRPALHAEELRFRHPSTGAAMEFHAPLPPDLETAVRGARAREEGAPA